MFNKIYVKVKNFIKENLVLIITFIVLYVILTFPLPYYIYNGGGILNLGDRITVNGKEGNQDINMCYVNQLKGNIGTYLLSYIIPSWDKEKIVETNYNYEEELYRNKILLTESINNALINAYRVAGKKIDITGEKALVTYVLDEAKTDIVVGDQIIKADNTIIHNLDEFKEVVNSKSIGDIIEVEVMSKEKKKLKKVEIIEIDNEKKAGIALTTNYVLETDPKVDVKFNSNEAGPSGGLMMTIGIYDRITNSNISKNKKICGTGTIDIEGNIGEIGGVKYKLAGSVKNDCDIFLSPTDNFKEVQQEMKKHNYNIDIYEAKTLDETLKYLLEYK